MREILYRAKAINRDRGYHITNYKNGDFVYGLVTRLYDERFENQPAEMTDINCIMGIQVDYKTIGQYTGLTDKNGTRIFEGDIVEDQGSHLFGKVVYAIPQNGYDEIAGFVIDDAVYGPQDYDGFWHDVEIVGNIHDTPELLKGVGK